MNKLYFFDKTKTYIYPDGTVASPEKIKIDFEGAYYPGMKYVVTSDEDGMIMYGIDSFTTLKSIHNIDPSLSDEEALQTIEDIMNTPPEIDTTPSPEERIAAALEFQALSSLPDEE